MHGHTSVRQGFSYKCSEFYRNNVLNYNFNKRTRILSTFSTVIVQVFPELFKLFPKRNAKKEIHFHN